MKVQHNKASNCNVCGKSIDDCLNMFTIRFDHCSFEFDICDKCNEELLLKTLKASTFTNGRLKKEKDINIINKRKRSSDKNVKILNEHDNNSSVSIEELTEELQSKNERRNI